MTPVAVTGWGRENSQGGIAHRLAAVETTSWEPVFRVACWCVEFEEEALLYPRLDVLGHANVTPCRMCFGEG